MAKSLSKVKKAQRESYLAQEAHLQQERKAKWEAENKAKLAVGSKVSKALFRLQELCEVLEEADNLKTYQVTITDAFENEKTVSLEEIYQLITTVTGALEPTQSVANGTISLWDDYQEIKAQNETLKDMAAGLIDFLPVDNFHQNDLLSAIERKGGQIFY